MGESPVMFSQIGVLDLSGQLVDGVIAVDHRLPPLLILVEKGHRGRGQRFTDHREQP